MRLGCKFIRSFALVFTVMPVVGGELLVEIKEVSPGHAPVERGIIRFQDSQFGLIVIPELYGLTPGPHGTHLHARPDCGSENGKAAAGAGDHYDPGHTGLHAGPYSDGHLGDFPNLIVEDDGRAIIPMLVPRVKLADLRGRAVVIHAGADRYGAESVSSGDAHASHSQMSGGARMYCGVVP